MAKKRKIKTRKDRLRQYNEYVGDMPRHDPVERIMYCLGDKLTESKVKKIIERKNEILKKKAYSRFKLTLYEFPVGSERPRSRVMGSFVRTYVPNAKDNKKYIEELISDLRHEIKIIHTPIYIDLKLYHLMPSQASIEDQVLFEAGVLDPVCDPDIDNAYKSYSDSLIKQILLDDDLVYKVHVQKFFSFLPRVEMSIYYQDAFYSKYIYNKIRTRKSFKQLSDFIEVSTVI